MRANTLDSVLACLEYEPNSGCWIWAGGTTGWSGYGRVKVRGKWRLIHRFVYEQFCGVIPLGLTLDHHCRLRLCANPTHLEPMSLLSNQRRGGNSIKTHCPRGHAYDGASGVTRRYRYCRRCDKARKLRRSRAWSDCDASALMFTPPEA